MNYGYKINIALKINYKMTVVIKSFESLRFYGIGRRYNIFIIYSTVEVNRYMGHG